MFVLSIFGLTKKKNPPLSFYFVLFKNIQHQFWTCGTLIYTITCTLKFSLKPRPISLQRTKAPSNYLSDLAIHIIILAIINTPTSLQKITYGGIDYTQSINLHMVTEQNMNIEDEGRGSREGSPDAS